MAPQKTEIEKMQAKQTWFLSIAIPLLILISAAWVRSEYTREKVDKIQSEYVSWEAVVYIIESNNLLIKKLEAIDEKDDKKYEESMKAWSDLQLKVMKWRSEIKVRGGSTGTQSYK